MGVDDSSTLTWGQATGIGVAGVAEPNRTDSAPVRPTEHALSANPGGNCHFPIADSHGNWRWWRWVRQSEKRSKEGRSGVAEPHPFGKRSEKTSGRRP